MLVVIYKTRYAKADNAQRYNNLIQMDKSVKRSTHGTLTFYLRLVKLFCCHQDISNESIDQIIHYLKILYLHKTFPQIARKKYGEIGGSYLKKEHKVWIFN